MMTTDEMTSPRIKGVPLFSIFMGLCAALVFKFEAVGIALQYDRIAIAHGEIWRSITGHWTHWNFEHFLWCTVVFVGLGAVCEQKCRKGFLITLLVAGLSIPAATWLIYPEMVLYRGLSGLGSSLFVFGLAIITGEKYRDRNWPGFVFAVTSGLFLIGKITYEFVTGHTLFVDNTGVFAPAPLAHLVGAGVGLVMSMIFISENNNDTTTL